MAAPRGGGSKGCMATCRRLSRPSGSIHQYYIVSCPTMASGQDAQRCIALLSLALCLCLAHPVAGQGLGALPSTL